MTGVEECVYLDLCSFSLYITTGTYANDAN